MNVAKTTSNPGQPAAGGRLWLPVLMYHEVASRAQTESPLAVTPRAFADQLVYLHDAGFRTVTAAALPASLAAGEPLDRTVVLTFDDGYEDFHRQALPVISRHGFTATVFVASGWVQDDGEWPAVRLPGRMLSWSQVAESAAQGIEIGAHSCQHPQLDQIPAHRLREELYASKARLEEGIRGRTQDQGTAEWLCLTGGSTMTHSPSISISSPSISTSSPSISVVICVYTEDRWDQIGAAVESVRTQTLPAAETIIVVDHNPALYKRLVAFLPDVTVVENREEQGLSGGRNTGAALARGEIIAFLDDDAFADKDWLSYLAEDYADPDLKGVSGLTLPNWQTARPSWMPEEFLWVVGANYRGLPPSGAAVRNLLGGNMSFRREVFDLVDGFQTGIGRGAESLPLGCEETLFCIRLGQRSPGSLLVLDRRAKVWHYVSDGRCRFSYFLSRCWAEGISKAQVAAYVGSRDGLSTERSYVTRTLPLGVARGIGDAFRGDPAGLGRAGSIIIGLGVTTAAYLRTRFGRAPRPQAT